MKRVRVVFFVILLILLSCVCSYAASDIATQCADALYELGLFSGTGKNADGTPIYSLDKTPTRAEAMTMLIRLLGKETEAKAQNWPMPFTDVPAWAAPYVGYAYNNGLTTGISTTKFGSSDKASEAQYCTFILRALGYNDSQGDFNWQDARFIMDTLGITSSDKKYTVFTRGSVVEISYYALSATMKDSEYNLLNYLYFTGAVSKNELPRLEHVYEVFLQNGTWSDAKAFCERQGGHLATITSQEEQDYILSISGGQSLWIGGYRDEYFNWYWVTGEPFVYTYWANGEPNNSSNVVSGENCIAIWPDRWNDLNDENTYEQSGFICEWE